MKEKKILRKMVDDCSIKVMGMLHKGRLFKEEYGLLHRGDK